MAFSLLSTKLYIPQARTNLVERQRLTGTILAGVARPGAITLLSGPAGFGKTTLLSDFINRYTGPVAWVSLDEGDNDVHHSFDGQCESKSRGPQELDEPGANAGSSG